MNSTITEIFTLSIVIAAIAAIAKWGKNNRAYYPFFALIWIATVNEILSLTLLHWRITPNINNNIYVLAESLIILWFFRKISTVLSNHFVLAILGLSFIIFWIVENFFIGSIMYVSSYFRIYYSFVVVILSISTVNHLIVTEKRVLVKMPAFLISMGFIIYFTYKILVEAFWVYKLNDSGEFRTYVFLILDWVNLFVNLLFALAILWIPSKRQYTLLS